MAAPQVMDVGEFKPFITNSIQIDMLNNGPGDANLFDGMDPADGSASANLPASDIGTFIDWNNLGDNLDNHRLLDLNNAAGRDDSAFPRSNECVASANVLSKMDLTYVGAATNNAYAYLLVQRSANNGDAGYYWLFTRKAPHLVAGGGPCSADEYQLVYDISGPDLLSGSGGDVLLSGHFKPSAQPLLQVYQATADMDNVPATDAIDFTNPLWQLNDTGVAAAAVNTTITAPGVWGSDGVKSMKSGNLDNEIVAEAAVDLDVFTSGSTCGATYYASVITRSSGAGGNSPDLKDLAGPARFNFGETVATAELTSTCGLAFEFDLLSAVGADGSEIENPVCEWSFSDGGTFVGCHGVHEVGGDGGYSATLVVTDPTSECSDEVEVASVNVYSPLAAVADLDATCLSAFNYNAAVTGGSPAGVSYEWLFSGGGVTPASSNLASGSVSVSPGNQLYTGDLMVTDLRDDGLVCTAVASDSATPYDPMAIHLTPTAAAPMCPEMSSDEVIYNATVSGGDGNYAITWSGADCFGAYCEVGSEGALCYGPIELQATVADGSGLCDAAVSEIETYEKVTTVIISDN